MKLLNNIKLYRRYKGGTWYYTQQKTSSEVRFYWSRINYGANHNAQFSTLHSEFYPNKR